MPVRLILIRHGETEWNRKKRYCGSLDVSLNATGRDQARRLRNQLDGVAVDAVYSSSRKRAVETARIIFKKRLIKKKADLRELHFGCFEGLTHCMILKKYASLYRKWLHDPFEVVIPGGENLHDFKKRVLRIFKKIVSRHRGETVAVVCHGGVIGIFFMHLLRKKNFWKLIPKSGSATIVEYKKDKPCRRGIHDPLRRS